MLRDACDVNRVLRCPLGFVNGILIGVRAQQMTPKLKVHEYGMRPLIHP